MRLLITFLSLCIFCLGCSTIQKPTAAITGMAVRDVTPQGFTLNFDVDLHNPNAIPLPLTNADYKLQLGGASLLEGKAEQQGTIPAGGSRTVSLPVKLTYENLLGATNAIRQSGGDVPYTLDGGLSLDSGQPLIGQLHVPLQYSGTVPLKQILQNPSVLLQSSAARTLAEKALGSLVGH